MGKYINCGTDKMKAAREATRARISNACLLHGTNKHKEQVNIVFGLMPKGKFISSR